MRSFIEGISSDELRGPAVAPFDTSFRMPRWMTGSAGMMAEKLREKGVSLPTLDLEELLSHLMRARDASGVAPPGV